MPLKSEIWPLTCASLSMGKRPWIPMLAKVRKEGEKVDKGNVCTRKKLGASEMRRHLLSHVIECSSRCHLGQTHS